MSEMARVESGKALTIEVFDELFAAANIDYKVPTPKELPTQERKDQYSSYLSEYFESSEYQELSFVELRLLAYDVAVYEQHRKLYGNIGKAVVRSVRVNNGRQRDFESDDLNGKKRDNLIAFAKALESLRFEEGMEWAQDGLCLDADPEAFFPEKGGSTKQAKKICSMCDVRDECLEYAIDNDERFGIWGGLSERERRKVKRQQATPDQFVRVA